MQGLKIIHNSEISNTLQWDSDYTAVESKIDNQRVYERNPVSSDLQSDEFKINV